MKKSTLAILIIWIYIVGGSFVQGFTLPNSDWAKQFSSFPYLLEMIAIAPIVVIISVLFGKTPGKTLAGVWIDRRFGQGSSSNFLKRLRSELLFACMCFAFGITGLIRTWQLHGSEGALVIGSFFASGGVGFVCAYFIVRARKLYEA